VHVIGVPPPQVPLWHVSPLVQALASLHGVPFVFGGFTGQVPPEHDAWV
jgi:hypothetical protein